MIAWPANILPLPSDSFSVDAEFANIRSKMDSGRVRQRPRFTKELELAKVEIQMNKRQYAWFKAFWVHKINNGNDWFTMTLPLPNGETLTDATIRFASDYRANHKTFENWDISATVEFETGTVISLDALDLAIEADGDLESIQEDIEAFNDAFPYDWTL